MSVVRLSRDEKRERTREELVAAAHKRFVAYGFHATTVDQIAADAGYTKGAVYGNFAAKEDLFFAVYERRADAALERIEGVLSEYAAEAGLERLARDLIARRSGDDGWFAVFFEFWAHIIRHPELRERFREIHTRTQKPFVAALERAAADRGFQLPADPRRLVVAVNAMQIGLGLEGLTQPDVVDAELGELMSRLVLEGLERSAS